MKIICGICLESIGRPEAVSLAVCGHVFDLTCILHCLQVNKKCPLCEEDVFINAKNEQFIRMYFSTDDSDEKEIKQLKSKINADATEIRRLNAEREDYNTLKQERQGLQDDLKRSRELITLLHENYNNMKIELSMEKFNSCK